MNEKIKNHLTEFAGSRGFAVDEASLVGNLRKTYLYRDEISRDFDWVRYLYVAKINGMYIGYIDGVPQQLGNEDFKFDPDSICEMEAYDEIVERYRKKAERED